MSKTTILELRQLESQEDPPILPDGTLQNGFWSNTLDVPIKIEEGDQIQVKSVYCDTAAASSGFIEVENDIPVSMTAAMYLTNYNRDQTYAWTKPDPTTPAPNPPNDYLRNYHNVNRPVNNLGDNNKWFLGEISESTSYTWNLPTVTLQPLDRHENSNRYGGVVHFLYTGVEPGATPYGKGVQITVPMTKVKNAGKDNPYPLNIRCAGSATAPEIKQDPNYPLSQTNGIGAFIPHGTVSNAGTVIATPQLFTLNFTIKGGPGVVYSPLEMSQLITDEINNAQSEGTVGINYITAGPTVNSMKHYPAMSPFLTTVLKNDQELQARATTEGTPIAQAFINATGYEKFDYGGEILNLNGNFYFDYNIQRMLNEHTVTGTAPNEVLTVPAVDCWVGTNQLALVFDEVENKLKWDIQHFPIYSGDTITNNVSANDGKPTALYNEAQGSPPGGGEVVVTKGVALQYSGIVWTDLSPASFWVDTLGFADAITPPNYTQGKLVYEGSGQPTEPNSFELITNEGVNTTGALPGLDLGVVHASADYTRPIWGDPANAKSGVERQTDDVSSIFSTRTWNTSVADEGYFVLDIGTNFTQNLIASNLTSHNTQSIINRYYTANSFTSDEGNGSILYEHKGEPIMLSEFNIAIRNPDRTLVSSHILQQKNSVFIEVVKA